MEVQNGFEVMLEKPINYNVTSMFWSQTMDLLAIVTESNSLEVFRMNVKAQKIFQIQEKETIASVALSPDSTFLVYGRVDGAVQIIRTQNGEKVFFYDNADDKASKLKLGNLESVLNTSNRHTRSSIETIKWVTYLTETSFSSLVPFNKNSKQNQLILSISPHAHCDKNALIKLRHLTENQTEFSLLMTSERDNTFVSLNGMILVATLDYRETNLVDFYVIHSTYFNKIYSVLTHTVETTDIYVVTYDCKEFNMFKQEIVKVNYLMAYVGELLTYAERSYKTICAQAKEIVKHYNNKITIEAAQGSEKKVSQAQEFYKLLTLGIPSKQVMDFITKDLYDTPFLQKLDENLTALFGSLHQVALESAQNVIERLTIVLKKLLDMSTHPKFQALGLDYEMLRKFEESTKELYNIGEILLIEATETKFDIRNFLIWLNKLALRNINEVESEIANVRSHLNKYTVDTPRLKAFLKDKERFQLAHLTNICFGQKNKLHYQPSFKIYNKKANPEMTPEKAAQFSNYKKILQDLQLAEGEIQIEQEPKTYKSVQAACREAAHQWLQISKVPIEKLNRLLGAGINTKKIGSVEADSNSIIKVHSHNDCMVIFFSESECSRVLHKYDCFNETTQSVNAPDEYYVADVSTTSQMTLVLLRSLGDSRMPFVGQLDPSSFETGQMEFTKKMDVQSDMCSLASSEKGLSSILVNKNKLIIVQ